MRKVATVLVLLTATCSWAVDVENSGFDGIVRQMPDGWTAPGQAADVFAVNDADGISGRTCLQYESQEALEETFVEQTVMLEPNTEYVLSAWFKSDGTTRPVVALHQPAERDAVARVASDGAQSWTQDLVRFNSGPLGEVQVRVYGDSGPGRISRPGESRIDDVLIRLAGEVAENGAPIPGGYAGPPPGENIALGKSYAWNVQPNYSLCTDPADDVQLTDGEHTVGYFWTQQPTVGWKLRDPLELTVDLESVQPITGVSFNTAGGVAGVGWPTMIFVLTSEDGENFEYHGELVALSAEHGLPDPQSYVVHRYTTDRLQAAGRYVRFVVMPGSQYAFTDEVEVYRGAFGVAQAGAGEPVESTEQLVAEHRLDGIVGVRMMYDIQDLRRKIDLANVPAALKRELSDRLNGLADEVRAQHVEDIDHWKGLPYNDLHARIYAVNAPLLRAEGHDELTIWAAGKWDPMEPMVAPELGDVDLSVLAMQGEYRSAAFNITNPRDETAVALISVEAPDLSDGTVTVHEVQYIQTQERQVISGPMPEARVGPDGAARIEVPAGVTKQVWLTIHPEDEPAGRHAARISVQMVGRTMNVPLTVEVAPIEMPRPPVSVFCWDYVGDRVNYAPGFTDLDRMAQDLRDHFVDAPWAHPGVLAWPREGTIDDEGHITEPLDWSRLDRWIARFPDARSYLVYAQMNYDLRYGLEDYSPRWRTAMGEWFASLEGHLRETGVDPSRMAILIIDEPHSEEAERKIAEIGRIMEETAPALRVFEDPVRPDPTEALQEMYEVSDILCPNLPRLYTGGQKAIDFYQALQEQGKSLYIYQCAGPHKLLDPITYHRHNFWHAWNLGATGSGFWGYVDSTHTGSSWDNFKGGGTSYSLVYVDDQNHFATSKQWEAVREGAEDYTILWMLQQAIGAHEGAETAAVSEARAILETLPQQVTGPWQPGAMRWVDERDRSYTDEVREQALRALVALQG